MGTPLEGDTSRNDISGEGISGEDTSRGAGGNTSRGEHLWGRNLAPLEGTHLRRGAPPGGTLLGGGNICGEDTPRGIVFFFRNLDFR